METIDLGTSQAIKDWSQWKSIFMIPNANGAFCKYWKTVLCAFFQEIRSGLRANIIIVVSQLLNLYEHFNNT